MTADLDAQVVALTQRLGDARKAHARADAEHDAAKASRDNAIDALTREFGVSNTDEARTKLEELQGQYADEIRALTEALNTMEGQP